MEFHPALTLFATRWVKSQQIAQEIASEAFVKTWHHHWKLDSYAGIRAYLYKTVRRDCQLAAKREERRNEIHVLSTQPNSQNETHLGHLIRSEAYRLVHLAMKGLPAASPKVIIMHFFLRERRANRLLRNYISLPVQLEIKKWVHSLRCAKN